MKDSDSKQRERALAIEFWIAVAITGGAFVAGLISAVRQLLTN